MHVHISNSFKNTSKCDTDISTCFVISIKLHCSFVENNKTSINVYILRTVLCDIYVIHVVIYHLRFTGQILS